MPKREGLPGEGIARLAFLATVVLAGLTFWLAPRPPMSDLAQHAGQVAALHDLLLGRSPWRALLEINYFTPYLIGYGLTLGLSFVMPVAAALKVVLTLGYWAFVACCVLLRARLGGDRRLDWLFVPGFLGFAYVWGFYTFLIALPVGVLFMVVAHRYAERPALTAGVVLLVLDLVLFFSHGMVFAFANVVGVGFLVLQQRRVRTLAMALLPYVALVVLCVIYSLVRLRFENEFAESGLHGRRLALGRDAAAVLRLPVRRVQGGRDLRAGVAAHARRASGDRIAPRRP